MLYDCNDFFFIYSTDSHLFHIQASLEPGTHPPLLTDILEALIKSMRILIKDLQEIYKKNLNRLMYIYFKSGQMTGVIALGALNLETTSLDEIIKTFRGIMEKSLQSSKFRSMTIDDSFKVCLQA